MKEENLILNFHSFPSRPLLLSNVQQNIPSKFSVVSVFFSIFVFFFEYATILYIQWK